MCGLVGIYGEHPSSLITEALETIKHRGPDYSATYSANSIHLGHTRLSIIDLSEKSNQPLWDISKTACIVFNGEIYNYEFLKQELIAKGKVFFSNGDAEVILNLYLDEGPDCLRKLKGIFAFAIWDQRKSELFIARDHFGVKPLYYVQHQQKFYFSSEVKALLTIPGMSWQLNYNAILRTIILLWSPGPETILQGVFKLEPGNYLLIKEGMIVSQIEYYQWPQYRPKKRSIKKIQSDLAASLQNSVQEQLISHVPLGAFLSGGLDSSLIVAMAKQAGVDDLTCFTIEALKSGKCNDGFVDDLPYAKKVAEYLNIELNILQVKPDIRLLLEQMIYFLDEPQADPAPINVLLICEEAKKKGIKVLLSGAGGDDIFTGYRRHLAIQYERYWVFLPQKIRNYIQIIARKIPKKNAYLRRLSKLFFYAGYSSNERLLSYFYWMDPKIAFDLFTDEIKMKLDKNPMQLMLNYLEKREETDPLEKMLSLERRYFLVDHNFNYTDKMSMAHGIEVRVPFLDKDLVSISAEIHSKIKQKGRTSKWVLKKVAEKYLPKFIIYRPKSGFGAPLREWLTTDLSDYVDTLLSRDSINNRGLFKADAVRKIIEDDRLGKEDYSYPIFALLCIEIWFRTFIDSFVIVE